MGEVQTTPAYVPPTDVDLLRVAARRAGLPFEVTVVDIENLAREYDKERLAQMLREGNPDAFTAAHRALTAAAPTAGAGGLDVSAVAYTLRDQADASDYDRLTARDWLDRAEKFISTYAAALAPVAHRPTPAEPQR